MAREVTLEDMVSRIERLPLSRYMWYIIVVVGFATFFDGFGLYTSTVTSLSVKSQFHLSTSPYVLYTTGVLIGNFIGDFIGGPLADRFGRRRFLWITVIIIAIGSLWTALSPVTWSLIASRVVTGIGIGADLIVAYAYLSEVTPSKVRGLVTGAMYIILVAGIPVAILLGYFLIKIFPVLGWRYLYLIGAIIAVFALLVRLGLPESPRFYFTIKQDFGRAESQIEFIENHVRKNLGGKLPDIVNVVVPEIPRRVSYKKLFEPGYGKTTLLATLIAIFGLVGGLSISFFVPAILVARGFSIQKSLLYTAVGALGLLFGPVVVTVIRDTMERRNQMIIYAVLTAFFGIFLGVAPTSATILIAAFLFNVFNQSWAAVYHMYLAEIFPTTVRSTGPGFADAWGRIGIVIASLFLFGLVTSLVLRLTLIGVIILLGAVTLIVIGVKTSRKTLEDISGG